jgi:hypothetical protein
MNTRNRVPLSAAAVVLLVFISVGCQTVTEPVIEPTAKPSESVEPAVRVDAVPLSIQVYGLYQRGGTGPLLPITNGSEMSSGDQYKVYFRANRDCYVYVYQTESTGKVFRLFPLQQFDGVMLNHQNPVQTLADYVLPANDRYFYLDDTIGTEKIYFVASLKRNRELETLDDRLIEAAVQGKDDAQVLAASRKIQAYLTDLDISAVAEKKTMLVAWGASERVAPITGYVFEAQPAGGVHSIEFVHR